MNPSVNSLTPSSSSTVYRPIPPLNPTSPQWFHYPHLPTPKTHRNLLTVSCALRRRRHFRRRRYPEKSSHVATVHDNPPPPRRDSKLRMVIDLERYLPDKASLSPNKLLKKAELKFHDFVASGNDAVQDLRTLITVEGDRRYVISCRKTTIYFMGQLFAVSVVTVFAFRVLVKLGLGFRNLFRHGGDAGGSKVITRMDRNLGGREVVVGFQKDAKEFNGFNVNTNPFSAGESVNVMGDSNSTTRNLGKIKKKLPDWWPETLPAPVEGIVKEEHQRIANRLIRAIMDQRTSGKDVEADDIILLRRVCRTSGVKVSIATTNTRDSIYRISVDFTLNTCRSVADHSTFVQIDGEDAPEFIAGLADNLGLESLRAATIVAAAVAAHTRSWLLQSWALVVQGKHIEALAELSKLCLIHRIFPPEESSPEMEMVARGLEKHLKWEQREYLLKMLIGISKEENRRSLVEALGLANSAGSIEKQQQQNMTS